MTEARGHFQCLLERHHVDDRPNAEHLLEAQQRQALVRQALEAIPVERRAVFIMHELDDISIPDVAAALDVPLNTTRLRWRAPWARR